MFRFAFARVFTRGTANGSVRAVLELCALVRDSWVFGVCDSCCARLNFASVRCSV